MVYSKSKPAHIKQAKLRMKKRRASQPGHKIASRNFLWLSWASKRDDSSDNSDNLPADKVEHIVSEFIRQNRIIFNITLSQMVINTLVTIVGVMFLLMGNLSEGTVITAVGLSSNMVANSRRLDRDNNEKLYRLVRISEEEEKSRS